MRKVDCLIVSTARAASTSMYHYLNDIGGLCLPANKEPHFWCDVEKYSGRYSLLDELYIGETSRYEELYRESKIVVDASVGYFFYIDDVISKLREFRQKPKALFLYREPTSRAASLFNELRRKGIEEETTLEKALTAAKNRSPGRWWEHYYDNVQYDRVFESMCNYFDEILAVNLDAIQTSPEETVGGVLRFLEIAPVRTIEYLPMNTSNGAILSMKLKRLRRISPFIPRGLKTTIRHFLSRFSRSGDTRGKENASGDVSEMLSMSVASYKKFRSAVQEKDIYDSRNR